MKTFKTEGKEKWAQLIGLIIIEFGEIERITIRCLRTFPSENIISSVIGMKLSSRVDLICSILESKFSNGETNKIIPLLKKAKKLAEKRNILAHNPMSLDIYENEEGEIFKFKEVIKSLKNEKQYIHFCDLETLYKDISAITPEMSNEYHKLEEINVFK